MKKILLSSVALLGLTAGAMAADLPSRRVAPAPMVAAVPLFTWTGLYVGGQVGYQFGDNDHGYSYYNTDAYRTLFGTTGYGFGDDSGDGFVAGAHVGYNFQFGSFVVGVEGDVEGVFGDDDDNHFGYGVLTTAQRDFLYANGYYGNGGLDWQGSIRARLGFAFDRVLVYGTGGFAFGGYGGGNGYYGGYHGGDDSASGWTAGLGVEYAFTNNLTARVEYRYTSLDRGSNNYYLAAPLTYYGNNGNDDDFHTVRVGVSYKF